MQLFKKSYEDENAVINRLSQNAGNVIEMLKNVLKANEDANRWLLLAYASGLAGYACHRAVIANNENFVKVKTNTNKIYYFGDDINKYLLENKLSVLCFINGAFNYVCPGKQMPSYLSAVKQAVSVVGNSEYKIWNTYIPEKLFMAIKECWDGIYDNMTAKYCKSAGECPIFFGIVLQNIMIDLSKYYNMETIYLSVLECMLFISKMDIDSI